MWPRDRRAGNHCEQSQKTRTPRGRGQRQRRAPELRGQSAGGGGSVLAGNDQSEEYTSGKSSSRLQTTEGHSDTPHGKTAQPFKEAGPSCCCRNGARLQGVLRGRRKPGAQPVTWGQGASSPLSRSNRNDSSTFLTSSTSAWHPGTLHDGSYRSSGGRRVLV